MSDFTIHVQSDGQGWDWYVNDAQGQTLVTEISRRITDVEDDARTALIRAKALGDLKYTGFTTEVVLRNPNIPDPSLPSALMCDIDGTLARHNNRGPFEFDKVETDDLDPAVFTFLDMYYNTGHVILLSGRKEEYREHTQRWLMKHLVAYDDLWMRPEGDNRSDDIVKLELFDNHVRGRFNVTHVLDDRDRCVYLWRKLGLPCWQVAEGNF